MHNSSIDIVSNYLKFLDNLCCLEYSKLQKQLMSSKYKNCVKSLILLFYDEDNITHKMICILGLLPVFLFNTKIIYSTFTYKEYSNMIKDSSISKYINIDSSEITNDDKLKHMFYKVYFLYKKIRYFMLKVDSNNFDELKVFIKSILDGLYNNYYIWEKLDKQHQLEDVIQNYWEIELTKKQINDSKKYSSEQKESIIHTLTTQQVDIKQIINQIDPKNGINMLIKSIPIIIDDVLVNHVKNNIELVYWNNIEKDIINNSNYSILLNTLNELRYILYYLDARDEFKKEVDEYFDIDFILSLIKNNVFDINYISGLHTKLYNWLSSFDAAVNDETNKTMFITLNDQLNTINDNINKLDEHEDNKKIKLIISSLAVLYNFYFHKFNNIKDIKKTILNNNNKK